MNQSEYLKLIADVARLEAKVDTLFTMLSQSVVSTQQLDTKVDQLWDWQQRFEGTVRGVRWLLGGVTVLASVATALSTIAVVLHL